MRIDIGKQTITFYATNCNTATYNFALKKIDKLGLEKPGLGRKADESVVRIEENSFIF